MSFGFPTNPSNKKQYISDGKSFEYDSDRGAWVVSVRPAVSASTTTVTDLSQLADPNSLLNNASSTLPVYTTEVSLYDNTANLAVGQMAYISENGKIAIWNGTKWFGATTTEYVPPPPATFYGDRAIFAGLISGSTTVFLGDYIDINSPSNATIFGDLTENRSIGIGAVSNTTYGVFMGGYSYSTSAQTTTTDYFTFAIIGNAQDFGDLTEARNGGGSASNGTYGLFAGGYNSVPQASDTIDYLTIVTPSISVDFGNLTQARYENVPGASDGTYGAFGGGYNISNVLVNVIDYVTIATPSSATNFGQMLETKRYVSGAGNGTYGFFAGGINSSNVRLDVIEYFTIATPSNATSFGNLFEARFDMGMTANSTYIVMAGGQNASNTIVDTIDYVATSTPGSATDFGNLTSASRGLGATSGAAA